MPNIKFMSRVKRFKGDMTSGKNLQPWVDCWIAADYDRVIFIYGCAVVTRTGQEEEHWKALAVFAKGNRVNRVLLAKDREQLEELWKNHIPLEREFTQNGIPGNNTVRNFLFREGVYISEKRLNGQEEPVSGITDWKDYSDDDASASVLFAAVEALIEIPDCGALRRNHIFFFEGDTGEYEPNELPPARMLDDDHPAAVAEYAKVCRNRPTVWHNLWTEGIAGAGEAELAANNYNLVARLTSCNFLAQKDECSDEEVWQEAVVFMHDCAIRDLLLISSAQLSETMHKVHKPEGFVFKYIGGQNLYVPLMRYLEKDTNDQVVQRLSISMKDTELHGAQLPMGDFVALNEFGTKLSKIIEAKHHDSQSPQK